MNADQAYKLARSWLGEYDHAGIAYAHDMNSAEESAGTEMDMLLLIHAAQRCSRAAKNLEQATLDYAKARIKKSS